MDLCLVVPNSTPPCFVYNQVASLRLFGIFNNVLLYLQYLFWQLNIVVYLFINITIYSLIFIFTMARSLKPTHLPYNNTKGSCQCTGRVTHAVRATRPRHLTGGCSAGGCGITAAASEWRGINIDEPCTTTGGLRSSGRATSGTWLCVVCTYGPLHGMRSGTGVDSYQRKWRDGHVRCKSKGWFTRYDLWATINRETNRYTAISRKVVGKKHQSARDKTERWSGYSLEFCILALRKCTSLNFCTWRIYFSSQEAFICSFTSTVTCLWVKKILLKFSVAKRTLFPHAWRERKYMCRFAFYSVVILR